MNRQPSREGFYFIEISIAIAILGIVVSAITNQLYVSYQTQRASGRLNQAVFLAEEGMGALKNIRDLRFFNISSTPPVYDVSGSAGPGSVSWGLTRYASSTTVNSLQRRIFITPLDTAPSREKTAVKIEVVWWKDRAWPGNTNPPVLLSLESVFENWGPTVIKWDPIIHLSAYDFDFDGANRHNARAAVIGSVRYLLVGNSAVGAVSGKEFVVFNISRSPKISVSSTLNLDGNVNDIYYQNSFAYVASDSNSQELQVVSIGSGAANKFGLSEPDGAVVDTVNHRLFVSDTDNNRILVYNLDVNDNLQDRIADNVLGQSGLFGDGSGSTQSRLNDPRGLAFDSANSRLFVSDYSNNRVLAFNVATVSNNKAADYVLGQSNFTVNGARVSQVGLNRPFDVAYDSVSRRLFIADSGNNRALVYDLSSGIANGMNASSVLGQPNFTGSSAATTQTGMRLPRGVAYDSGRRLLFVGDHDNSRFLVFNASSGIANGMNASSVLGQTTFTVGVSGLSQSRMNDPENAVYDSVSRRLFIADGGNNRALVYDLSSGIANGMNASSVLGQPDFTTRVSVASQTGLASPRAFAYEGGNRRLFVSDDSNNRIAIFNLAGGITNGMAAADLLGQYDQAFNPDYTKSAPNNSGGALAVLFNTVDITETNGNDDALAVSGGGNCGGTCLYVGRASGGNKNFFVFDITTAADPKLIGSTALPDGYPRSIAVPGPASTFAYVAAQRGNSQGAFIKVRVSPSSTPAQVWSYLLDEPALSVTVNQLGTRAYVSTKGSNSSGRDGVYSFDISADPPVLTSPSPNPFDDNGDIQNGDEIVKVSWVPDNNLMMVIQRSGGADDKIMVLDVSGDQLIPLASSTLGGATLNSFAWSDFYTTAYVVSHDDPEIKIIIPSSTWCKGC